MSDFPLSNVIQFLHSDADNEIDFEVHHNSALPEPFTIPVWNSEKLGTVKTITEYRAISETPAFKAWYRNWYRERKIAHGNSPEQANEKVVKAFGEPLPG